MRATLFLLLTLIALVLCSDGTEDTLELAIGIQRHCPRAHQQFYESYNVGMTEGDVHCLPIGLDQAVELGKRIAERYFPLIPNGFTYSPALHTFESSDLDRTLQTGEATIKGLFGPNSYVVTHSTQQNMDIIIRGFDKCAVHNTRVAEWTKSEEYISKDKETAEFRERLAEPLQEPTELLQWFNVYDGYTLQKIYNQPEGDPPAPIINQSDFQQVIELADWVESRRYGKNIAGPYSSSGLVGEIRFRFNAEVTNDTMYGHRFMMYFSHYSTIMALMAALQFDPTEYPANEIPDFLAILFLELHFVTGLNHTVRLTYINGVNDTFHNITWPLGTPCGGLLDCPYSTFLDMTAKYSAKSVGEFCTICDNCEQFIKIVTDGIPGGYSQGMTLAVAGVVGGVIMLIICIIVGAIIYCCVVKKAPAPKAKM